VHYALREARVCESDMHGVYLEHKDFLKAIFNIKIQLHGDKSGMKSLPVGTLEPDHSCSSSPFMDSPHP
jgi:hypothetical protein